MRKILIPLSLFVASTLSWAIDSPSFLSKPMLAGKALLADNGFVVNRTLGMANFPPELRLPIQLVYNSANQKAGILGWSWSIPQLESRAYYDRDGMIWVTPWGEKIKFFDKNEKVPKDAIKIEIHELAKKGYGFYAPYSNWEATTRAPRNKIKQSGDWIISGKNDFSGWRFVYRDSRLLVINAPSGRAIAFNWQNDKLISVSHSGLAFVELDYADNHVKTIKINGVKYKFSYSDMTIQILPRTLAGKVSSFTGKILTSHQHDCFLPEVYAYDEFGYLSSIKRGDFVENLVVDHETLNERKTNIMSAPRKSKVKHTGRVAGRILKDREFSYSYKDGKPGKITLTNALNQMATYDYDANRGIFVFQEFSGKKFSIYYFMRYDVAYLGRVRKILDGRERAVASYRYDNLTGKIIRFRDMAENDIDFIYDRWGKLSQVTRRAASQKTPEPIRAYSYSPMSPLPIRIAQLDADGKISSYTNVTYNKQRQPICISNGQTSVDIEYSATGYPIAVRDIFGRIKKTAYDKYNRTIAVTNEFNIETRITYSSAGLVSKIERRDGTDVLSRMKIDYDDMGRPVRYADQAGRTKILERDHLGRILREVFPDNTSVGYTYDAVGKLHTVLDQNNHTITFDWGAHGLNSKLTAAGQLTDYVHDSFGLLSRVNSVSQDGKIDRSIKYTHDKFDRIVKIDYGNGEIEERTYDSWGKLLTSKRGDATLVLKYDYFGRIIERREKDVTTRYEYNAYGQRLKRIVMRGEKIEQDESRTYDKFGRLTSISSQGKTVEFQYNDKNQLAKQIINGQTILFSYTKYGQLQKKTLLKNSTH